MATETETTIVNIVNEYRQSSINGLKERRRRNERNRLAYDNVQDWSHKIEGQSREFIPKTSQTVEQMVAFMRRGLTQFGPWFQIELSKGSPLSDESARQILLCMLDHLPQEDGTNMDFSSVMGDALKVGLLESDMIFKTHGRNHKEKRFSVEGGEKLVQVDLEPWRLHVDAIRPEDYNYDLSGRGLFEIHTVERDLYQVKEMASMGIYDEEVISMIRQDFEKEEEERRKRNKEDEQNPAKFRHRVRIDEFWGTLVDRAGDVVEKNVLLAIANEKYLIRAPEENPNWHGESPFDRIRLIRKPFEAVTKALYDEVVPLNHAMNEVFNLMLDGAIAAAWGVRQVHPDWLEDPSQISDGIPQNKTLVLREGVPEGAKVVEQVTEGQVSGDSLAMFNVLNEALNGAAKTSEINLGLLPDKQVKAIEVSEASQNSAVVLDSIVGDVERGLERLLRKAFMTVMQNADDLSTQELQEALTRKEMLALARMSPAERFAFMGSQCQIKVSGISSMLAKAKDFQKIMALLQVVATNPILMNSFVRKYSGQKILDRIIKVLNMNPRDLEYDEDDDAETQVANTMGFMQQMSPGQKAGSRPSGEAGQPAEINQAAQPSQVA